MSQRFCNLVFDAFANLVAGAGIEPATRGFSTQGSLDPIVQHNGVLTFRGEGRVAPAAVV
jgi:hypothetical protein